MTKSRIDIAVGLALQKERCNKLIDQLPDNAFEELEDTLNEMIEFYKLENKRLEFADFGDDDGPDCEAGNE